MAKVVKPQIPSNSINIFWNDKLKKWRAIISLINKDVLDLDIDNQIREIINGTVDAVKKSQENSEK